MLLTQLLSASPLAVPQLTTSAERRLVSSSSSISSTTSNILLPGNEPQLIRKQLITNWSEKPPDNDNHEQTERTKDLLIPLKSHFESFIKHYNRSNNNNNSFKITRTKRLSNSTTENNSNVYFERANNATEVEKLSTNFINDEKYKELLQQYKNDPVVIRENEQHSDEFYQITQPATTNNDFSIKLVWIAAVIAISILGLVVGVLIGGPPICLGGASSSTSGTTQTSTTNNNNSAGGGAAANVVVGGAGTAAGAQSQLETKDKESSAKRAFELISSEKYETFDIHKSQGQVSGSQDKRNSTCKPDHTVPMLSVQTPGCAGMEWLGVPPRTQIATSTTRDERSRRRRDAGNNETSSSSSSSSSSSITTKSNQYNNHYPYSTTTSGMTPQICPNSNNKSSIANQYPHHVQLPDGEYGDDRHLQIRTPSQQSEILRTYTRAPPNRTVSNVPDQLNYRRTSNSATNINEQHFGSGRSIATSSNSTPVSKIEKSKHNSKLFSFLGFNKGPSNTSKSSDLSSIGGAGGSRSINNNNNTNHVTSSSSSSTATFSNNPPLEGGGGGGGASSHLLNITSLPVSVVRNHPSDHLTVNNYPSISSSHHHHNHHHHHHHHNKPISCPTSPSSPIEQAASIDDAEEDEQSAVARSSSSDKILSSSLESPKSSKYM